MPLVAAAVCPHPPMLVPEVAAGAASELNGLRAACHAAVAHLWAADLIVVVGADATTIRREPPFGGTLAPWGIDRPVGAAAADPLPLSLLIGAWLLEDREDREDLDDREDREDLDIRDSRDNRDSRNNGNIRGNRKSRNSRNIEYQSVAADASPEACAALGRSLVPDGTSAALLILGDGSACRGEKSPGYDDPRAEGFDTAVAEALAKGDAAALLELDPALASQLLAVGRAPWQVLAGAVGTPFETTELLHHSAPYGVGYLVASWR